MGTNNETLVWNQLGIDLYGEAGGDKSGWSVSLSADSKTVAIGASGNNENGTDSGHVRVYNFNGTGWVQKGGNIIGEFADDQSGYSVSLNDNGTIVAIGAIYNDGTGSNSGHVRVYNFNNGSWDQLGADIDGEIAGDQSGYSVSLSDDGTTVAIGAKYNGGNGYSSGHVRVYELNDTNWVQKGTDIDGEAVDDWSGSSVSLSADGTTVAIGATGNDENGTNSGHVRVYNFNGTGWVQKGGNIDGKSEYDWSGWSVSLSENGTIVAIGAIINDDSGTNSGHVRVYEFDGTDWSQLGMNISGENAGDQSGTSVSLSVDGKTVAIGAIGIPNGSNSGHVRVYEFDGTGWSQLGMNISGENAGDQSGYSVSLSADGKTVAIGAIFNDNENGTGSGHVRVYKLSNDEDNDGVFDINDAFPNNSTETKDTDNDGTGDNADVFPTNPALGSIDTLVWNQLGIEISVESVRSLSLSANGNTVAIAIGAHYDHTGHAPGHVKVAPGHVKVYKFNTDTWSQIGANIDGEAAMDYSGNSVSLSVDGTIVAIGATGETGSGRVKVYNFNNGSWVQKGADIDGEAANDWSGYSVSLNDADGTIVAIGATNNDGLNGNDSGHVRVYKFTSDVWTPVGDDIDGENADDQSGWSVSLSADGTTVAIGAKYNNGNGIFCGHVRVYELNGTGWVQKGTDINGEAAYDLSGGSVSLSADGSIVAIGAIYNDGNGTNSGHVRVYELNGTGWVQKGTDINGEAGKDRSGHSVSLSADGTIVAIGNDGNYNCSVRVYKFNNGSWVLMNFGIDNFGKTASLSADGTIVAIGATNNYDNGSSSGHVRVYKLYEDPLRYKLVGTVYQVDSINLTNSNITSITIRTEYDGKSVTSIGDNAFENCTNLTNITIPDTVTSIGQEAFSGCTSLTNITIPNTVTSIGDNAFTNGKIVITSNSYGGNWHTSNVVVINYYYLDFQLIENSTNCTVLAKNSFKTSNIQVITIPTEYDDKPVTSIANGAFADCTSLKSITIPNSVTSIGQFAFDGCTSLINITIPNSVTSIGPAAFAHCTGLTNITIPDTVTSIGQFAFDGCTSLISITIPNLVTSIGEGAFAHCTGLTNITIPNSVTSIGLYAFAHCTSLTSIIIPDSVTSIEHDAFQDCTSLTGIYLNWTLYEYSKLALGFPIDYYPFIFRPEFRLTVSPTQELDTISNDISTHTQNKYIDLDSIDLVHYEYNYHDIKSTLLAASADGTVFAVENDQNQLVIYKRNSNSDLVLLGNKVSLPESPKQVSLSADGHIVAISGPTNSSVRVYKYIDTYWFQMGDDIASNDNSNNYLKYSVSLSADGKTVAIGNDGNYNGSVRVYKFNNGSWVLMNFGIDTFGNTVSLSADGKTVAIGAKYNNGNGYISGHVRVYNFNGTDWARMGDDIDGENAPDQSGDSVSLSADGTTVAIGAIYNEGNGDNSGHVRVYKFTSDVWTPVGDDIDGENAGDQSGSSVSLSADGTIVAIGAPYYDGNYNGYARVYKFNNGSWVLMNFGIDNFGKTASLSADGTKFFYGDYTRLHMMSLVPLAFNIEQRIEQRNIIKKTYQDVIIEVTWEDYYMDKLIMNRKIVTAHTEVSISVSKINESLNSGSDQSNGSIANITPEKITSGFAKLDNTDKAKGIINAFGEIYPETSADPDQDYDYDESTKTARKKQRKKQNFKVLKILALKQMTDNDTDTIEMTQDAAIALFKKLRPTSSMETRITDKLIFLKPNKTHIFEKEPFNIYSGIEIGDYVQIHISTTSQNYKISHIPPDANNKEYKVESQQGGDSTNNTWTTAELYEEDEEYTTTDRTTVLFGGAHGTGSSGSSAGADPYIHTISGHVYKLPDREENYRYLESKEGNADRFLIDVSVKALTKEEKKELLTQHVKYNYDVLLNNKFDINGHFFRDFYISNKNNNITINLEDRTIKAPDGEITIDQLYKKGGIATYKNFEIKVIKGNKASTEKLIMYKKSPVVFKVIVSTYNEIYGNVEVELISFFNKQVRNGIKIKTDAIITRNNSRGACLIPQPLNKIKINKLGSSKKLKDVKDINISQFKELNEKFFDNQTNFKYNMITQKL